VGAFVTYVTWNPAWETGIHQIDEQHRQLLAQFEGLLAGIHMNQADAQIPGLISFLADYVDTHFLAEEFHMKATKYSGFAEHKAIHEGMRARVAQLVDGCRKDPATLTEEVLDYLSDWLITHINEHDRRMAHHIVSTYAVRARMIS
jgi:hemerythrin